MKKKNKVAILIAARSGSKRLPGKHFLKVSPRLKLIDLCILRLKKVKLCNKIFICTTEKKEDNKFKKICWGGYLTIRYKKTPHKWRV